MKKICTPPVLTAAVLSALALACSSGHNSSQSVVASLPLEVTSNTLWSTYQATLKAATYQQQIQLLAQTSWHDYFNQVKGTLSNAPITIDGHVFSNVASTFVSAEADFTAMEAKYPTVGAFWNDVHYNPLAITETASAAYFERLSAMARSSEGAALDLVDQSNVGLNINDPAQMIQGGYSLPTTNPQTGQPYHFCGGTQTASNFNQATSQWSWNAASKESCVVNHTGALSAAEIAHTVGATQRPTGMALCNPTTEINSNLDAGSHGSGTYGWVETGGAHSGIGHSCYNQ